MNKTNLPVKGQKEARAYGAPDLNVNSERNQIEGHASVYDSMYDMYWFNEVVERGAFDNTDFKDVKLTINHNLKDIPLARSRNNNENSTLELKVDEIGLKTRAVLDVENNERARALYGSVERKDMDGMSFIFIVRGEKWENLNTNKPTRRITDIEKVIEVSVVSFPASGATDINARSADALDSAKQVLESARAAELESSKNEQRQKNEVEALKLKAKIKSQI